MEENAKSKILQTLIDSFTAMPSWLRSALVIALVLGFFYFGYARKEIIYSQEKQTTEAIYGRINDMNQKILKIEDLRVANEDMIYSIEEVRGIVVILYELHRQDAEIISSYMKKLISVEEYTALRNELEEHENEYRKTVNELFNRRARRHLLNTKLNSEEDDTKK